MFKTLFKSKRKRARQPRQVTERARDLAQVREATLEVEAALAKVRAVRDPVLDWAWAYMDTQPGA